MRVEVVTGAEPEAQGADDLDRHLGPRPLLLLIRPRDAFVDVALVMIISAPGAKDALGTVMGTVAIFRVESLQAPSAQVLVLLAVVGALDVVAGLSLRERLARLVRHDDDAAVVVVVLLAALLLGLGLRRGLLAQFNRCIDLFGVEPVLGLPLIRSPRRRVSFRGPESGFRIRGAAGRRTVVLRALPSRRKVLALFLVGRAGRLLGGLGTTPGVLNVTQIRACQSIESWAMG